MGQYCSCHAAHAEQGELSEMCLQNLLLNLPPHAVDKLKVNTMEYDDAEAYEVSVDYLECCKGSLRNVLRVL